MPMFPERSPDWLTTLPIAHRGLHDNNGKAPENSLAAFQLAVEHGYPIELDVHLLRDGQIIVFHDDCLQRMTGRKAPVSECSSETIHDLMLLDSKERIPYLNQVLDLVSGKVPLLIEVKNRTADIGVLESRLLEDLSQYKGLYAVESFNPLSLQWFLKNAPQVIRGQLSGDFRDEKMPFYEKALLRNLLLNLLTKPDFIAYDFRCLPYWMVSFATRRIPLIGWTCRSKDEHKTALAYCDNVIFEGYFPNDHGE